MTAAESFGRTIQLFLVDGTPTGLRKATIHGWTGLIFVATASTFAALSERAEVDRTGVYILSGPDPDRLGETRVHIGSANSVREWIKQSAVQRDFWEPLSPSPPVTTTFPRDTPNTSKRG